MHQRSTFNRLSSETGTIGLLAALVAINSTPPQIKHEINCWYFSDSQNNIKTDEKKQVKGLLMKLTRQILHTWCRLSVLKRGIFVSAISGSQGGKFYQQGDTSWHLRRR
jgi:hypothetical protein